MLRGGLAAGTRGGHRTRLVGPRGLRGLPIAGHLALRITGPWAVPDVGPIVEPIVALDVVPHAVLRVVPGMVVAGGAPGISDRPVGRAVSGVRSHGVVALGAGHRSCARSRPGPAGGFGTVGTVRRVRVQAIGLGATLLERGAGLIELLPLTLRLGGPALRGQLLLLDLLRLALRLEALAIGLQLVLTHREALLLDRLLLACGLVTDLGSAAAVLLALALLAPAGGDHAEDDGQHHHEHDHHPDGDQCGCRDIGHGRLLAVVIDAGWAPSGVHHA